MTIEDIIELVGILVIAALVGVAVALLVPGP